MVYFTEAEETGAFYIHLYNIYDSNTAASTLVLTAAPNPNGVNGNNAPTSLTQAGNVYWANLVEGDTAQQWVIETVIAGEDPYTSDWATNFPTNSYYVNDNNESYPKFVGECTWYCKGRFLEVNNIANCASGHAATWINNYNASTCDCDTTNKTLREKSIAVFGSLTDPSAYGHVVFIESLTQNYVCFSECNVMATLSNGEIEVRNSLLPNAMDGYRQSITKAEFSSLYGYQLLGIIYKK